MLVTSGSGARGGVTKPGRERALRFSKSQIDLLSASARTVLARARHPTSTAGIFTSLNETTSSFLMSLSKTQSSESAIGSASIALAVARFSISP